MSAPDAEPRRTLPRLARLRKSYEFRRVYGRGRRLHGRAMTVIAFTRRSPGHRIGVAVSKDHGCAVRRNKIKRLLREAFRLERPELPGRFDVVLIPKRRDGKYALDEFRGELRALLEKANRQPADGERGNRRRGGGGTRGGNKRRRAGRRARGDDRGTNDQGRAP